ncbi:MAG: hypothetical protein KatS3mg010_0162 [Acidimicrobiia bacterium]|nr:MAG: hypothetical protein KatS3mg010_0162 [Acidimicrobiia bacterium]
MAADYLVVGLGNPGEAYARTRHNVGAEVVEILAKRHGARLRKSKDRALVGDVRIAGRHVVLAVPQTYMNDSGIAVGALARRHETAPERIVVVHDELDLEPAVLRVKAGGGLAGHNGLRSIKQHLKSPDFLRVRIGVGKPASKDHGADHVPLPVRQARARGRRRHARAGRRRGRDDRRRRRRRRDEPLQHPLVTRGGAGPRACTTHTSVGWSVHRWGARLTHQLCGLCTGGVHDAPISCVVRAPVGSPAAGRHRIP